MFDEAAKIPSLDSSPMFSLVTPPCVQSDEHVTSLRNEIEVLMMLRDDEGVVSLEAVLEDELNVHMVMESCNGGDLFDCISACDSLVEDDARRLFRWVGCSGG